MAQVPQKKDIKINNLRKVFRLIQKKGPIERKEIQELSNLSWGAVSQFTSALVHSDIITQNINSVGNVGKAPLTLDINSQDNYIVGVDFNFVAIRVVVLDLKGNMVKSRVAAVTDSSRVIELLLDTLDKTLSEFIGVKNLLAISISTQGNIDEKKGVALYLTFVPTWRNLNLKEVVEERFHISTFVFHDPDCILIAEKYFGNIFREDFKNVVTLNMNYGIGMSLMINNKIYSSASKRSGELGHTTVIPGGALCSCGKKGCLEAYASKVGILNRFVEAINNKEASSVNIDDAITYEIIKEYAQKGDPLCVRLFSEAGNILGLALSSLVSIFDPDAIILFGEFANDRELFKDNLEETFQKNLYPGSNTKLLYSNLGGSAAAFGAAFFALDKILNDFLMEKTEKAAEEN